MGLPIERLIVATNVNDILHRALSERRLFGRHGHADRRADRWTSRSRRTSSGCCSIVGGRDGAALAAQMAGFEATKAMRLTNAQREGAAALFASARADADDMSAGDALGLGERAAR